MIPEVALLREDGAGNYHIGRGGAGNIDSPRTKPAGRPHDEDAIPEAALARGDHGDTHHIGGGGAGNERPVDDHKDGFVDKLKAKILHK